MQASIDFDGTLTGSIAGGGGGGSDVSITPTYNQGKKIAAYSIDGNGGAIYTPEIEILKYVSSGLKICEIEGVEIFAPSYGYIDTLGDSNVEQIGGFSQGANVTPVNVKRVSYTNDVSNGEKIGSLTVGDSSYNVYQKVNSILDYSTSEQATGIKWIDGKMLYRRVLVVNNIQPDSYSEPLIENVDYLYCGGLTLYDSSNKIYTPSSISMYNYQGVGTYYASIEKDVDNILKIANQSRQNTISVIAIVYYTKVVE